MGISRQLLGVVLPLFALMTGACSSDNGAAFKNPDAGVDASAPGAGGSAGKGAGGAGASTGGRVISDGGAAGTGEIGRAHI